MDRESAKHNPRVDDSMKKEAKALVRGANEPRVSESREVEPPADGERTPDRVGSSSLGNASLTHDEVEFRQDLARYLDRTIWPATREAIMKNASEHGALDHVLEAFRRLPSRTYDDFPQVWEDISGHREPRRM